MDVILTLSVLQGKDSMKTSARVKARGFIEGLLRYETILTAQIFLRIFEKTSPLSKYFKWIKWNGHPLCPLNGCGYTRGIEGHFKRL